jgi:hypothetical protein
MCRDAHANDATRRGRSMTELLGIFAVMMCPMIGLGVTLYFSAEATKEIGKEL